MKELDKDALLEEAKRRYPVGTKFKVVHSPEAIRKVTSHEKHDDTFVKASDGLHINFISDLIEGGKSSCISASVYFNGKWAEIVEEPKVETKEEFVLPEYWFLRFKTKEVFDELCKKYAPDFIFFENAGICNNPTKLKLGNYYYLTKDTKYGEEITFDQFKKYVLKQEVKSMKEWSVGSYVVWLTQFKEFKIKVGTIDEISEAGDSRGMGSTKLFGSTAFLQRNNKNLKWFPTLQEAQKFSDELLGKSKTSLGVEDLVKGAIYCSLMSDKPQWESLHLYHGNGENMFKYRLYIHSSYKGNDKFDKSDWGKCTSNQYRLATSLEKKWLKTCIKQDKFIEQSELDKYDDEGNLMESEEYPEYYECIKPELWKNTIKSNNGNLIFSGNFITKTGNTIEHEHLHQYGHFKISTKAAYDAQFKKDKDYKVGDYVITKGFSPDYDGRILKIRKIESNEYCYFEVFDGGYFGKQHNFSITDILRKALPHEIPVENSVKQYPYTPEESIKLDFEVKWKEPRYIGGVDSITATGWGIYEQMKKQPIQSRKTPDLIDKSKVEVKIKRTKVKQIKL